MTKLFKNSKNALAFVLAFAVIAVSLFTGIAINADAQACADMNASGSNVWWNAWDLDDSFIINAAAGVGDTEANPYIITNSRQLRQLAQKFDAKYVGKYFKIADGVDIICLQSSDNLKANLGKSTNKEALDAFMALSSYTEVKEYFDTHTAKDKYQSAKNAGVPFDAHLDFNGATIVGMYNEVGGLFSQVGPNASFKNLKITNSYVTSGDGAGALFGAVYDYDNGTAEVVSGTVKVDNVEITNTYVSTSTTNKRAGVLFGYTRFKDTLTVSINNVLIHGCTSVIAGTAYNSLYGLSGSNLSAGDESKYPGCNWQFENSILLGITPWRADLNNSFQPDNPDNFKNVYTDITELNSGFTNYYPDSSYTGKITTVTANKLSDITSSDTCKDLDYTNTWIMTVNGPQLRALHGEFKATSNGADGHTLACEDCGLKTSTTSEPHDWSNKDGVCKACSATCDHSAGNNTETVSEATCSAAKTVKNVCKTCGKTTKDPYSTGKPLGHKLGENLTKVERDATCTADGVKTHYECSDCKKWFSDDKAKNEISASNQGDYVITAGHDPEPVVAVPATCTADGIAEHYKCKRTDCGKLFTDADSKNETTLDALKINATGHTAQVDKDDKVLYEQKDGKHYKICATCSTQENEILFDGEDCDCDEFTANNNGTHSGACKVCDLEVTENCTLKEVEEVAATTEKEGVKAHYECEVCGALYEDAEGKTSTTLEKLAIAKLENKVDDTAKDDAAKDDSKNDNNTNGTTPTVNGDKNNESPKTGDNVALAVSAVVAIIAAGYVLVRKFVKA